MNFNILPTAQAYSASFELLMLMSAYDMTVNYKAIFIICMCVCVDMFAFIYLNSVYTLNIKYNMCVCFV